MTHERSAVVVGVGRRHRRLQRVRLVAADRAEVAAAAEAAAGGALQRAVGAPGRHAVLFRGTGGLETLQFFSKAVILND